MIIPDYIHDSYKSWKYELMFIPLNEKLRTPYEGLCYEIVSPKEYVEFYEHFSFQRENEHYCGFMDLILIKFKKKIKYNYIKKYEEEMNQYMGIDSSDRHIIENWAQKRHRVTVDDVIGQDYQRKIFVL